MQVPDAVYYMMRNTPLIECNLSSNVITKIPAKFPTKFSFIKKLDLSHNRMSTLPEEITELTQLESVDISHNSFISLPSCLFNARKISAVSAKKNFIVEVDVDLIVDKTNSNSSEDDGNCCSCLKELNLEENPLSRSCRERLMNDITNINITLTEMPELEDWEDLNI